MPFSQTLLPEFDAEMTNTRKLLERASSVDPDAQVRQICAAVLSG